MGATDLVTPVRPGHERQAPDVRPTRAAATWALFAGIGLLMLGNGLQGTLVGIRSQSEGFSTTATGLVMAAYFAGFLLGSRTVMATLRSVGHIRVFAGLASLASAAMLTYVLSVSPSIWAIVRFVTGFCIAGLFVVAESWINDLATNRTRGRLLAAYMVVTMGGMALGQLLVGTGNPDGFQLFVIASVLVSLSLVPVTLSAANGPPTPATATMPLRQLAAIVPSGVVVAFLVGMAHGALIGMGAVYATAVGLSPTEVAAFMAAPMAGGVAFQLPVGYVSDHLPRRGVMFTLAAVAAAAATALLVVEPGSLPAYGLMTLIGGMSFPLYSLGIAYANDWLEPGQMLGASAALVTLTGVGAVLGPLLAAGLMRVLGDERYVVSLIVTHAAIVAFLAWRLATRDGLPLSAQGEYQPFPARASAVAANLLRRKPGPR